MKVGQRRILGYSDSASLYHELCFWRILLSVRMHDSEIWHALLNKLCKDCLDVSLRLVRSDPLCDWLSHPVSLSRSPFVCQSEDSCCVPLQLFSGSACPLLSASLPSLVNTATLHSVSSLGLSTVLPTYYRGIASPMSKCLSYSGDHMHKWI